MPKNSKMDNLNAVTHAGGSEVHGRYLLELDDTERKSLMRTLRKVPAGAADTETVDTIRLELSEMAPVHGIIIESPNGVDLSDIQVSTSLQLPLNVIVVCRGANNEVEARQVDQVRDPDRVRALVASIMANKSLAPLLQAMEQLQQKLTEACEDTNPDTQAIEADLDEFERILRETKDAISRFNKAR